MIGWPRDSVFPRAPGHDRGNALSKVAEFRERGGEVYLPADTVVATLADAEETVAAD